MPMTYFKSRLDAFYAQEEKRSFEVRFQVVWAIGVGACYGLWISTPPANRITRFAIIFSALGAVVLLAALWLGWRVRRVINRLRSMAPDDRDEVLGRHLSPDA